MAGRTGNPPAKFTLGKEKFDPEAAVDRVKQKWLADQKAYRKQLYRKSKYPAMSIEPFRHERQRLPFQMSAEDRALRQQWVRDQMLSPNEPRHVPEARPRNIFRRAAGVPWDMVTKALHPVLGHGRAHMFRYLVPKVLAFYLSAGLIASYIKNNRSSWEHISGWNIYSNRLRMFPGDDAEQKKAEAAEWELFERDYHEKHCAEFYDQGFSKRKTHLNL